LTEMMVVQEVAEYLRVKERKIYDLITQKQIPCTRVTGKWLFSKDMIDLWLMQNSETTLKAPCFNNSPEIVVGSHDPLLEWALRESSFPMALQISGSLEGLNRFAAGEAILCGMHVLDIDSGEYNVPIIKNTLQDQDIVVLEWAWREQGLVVASGNPMGLHALSDLVTKKARLIGRQTGSGSKILLDCLLEKAGIESEQITIADRPVRTEMDVGFAVSSGKADAGIAIEAVARQLHLDFMPLAQERFDIVLHRYDYFEPPIQKFLEFIRSSAFIEKARELGGYDISNSTKVVFNMR